MRRIFDRGRTERLGRRVSDGRPEPRAEFLRELTKRLAAPGSGFSGSRLAFSLALTVFVIGSFAALGGLGYASAGAKSVVKALVHPDKVAKLHSSASAQYTSPPPPKLANAAGASAPMGKSAAGGTLPFTGTSLAITTVLGFTLLTVGLILRRREKQRS